MLVTHFLIQPDPEGVKLQGGWNERAFSELTLTVNCIHHFERVLYVIEYMIPLIMEMYPSIGTLSVLPFPHCRS